MKNQILSPKKGNKARISITTSLIQLNLKVLARTTGRMKNNRHTDQNRSNQTILFADDMIICVENA